MWTPRSWASGRRLLQGLGRYRVGSNVFGDAGTLVPVNTAALLPVPDDRTTALTNATLTQFLSPQFGVVAGNRGYQPGLALCAEQDDIVADEFRDGNVPAGSGNRRVVEKVY